MKFKQKRRLEAAWLAALLLVQVLTGAWPPVLARASAKTIQIWDENNLMDYDYRFNMKFQEGVTEAVSFGCDNLDKDAFTNHGRNERRADTCRLDENYQPGSAGIRYNNIGKDENGNIVDVRITLMGVENVQQRYDLQTPIARYTKEYDPESEMIEYDWKDNISYPVAAFSLNSIGIYIYCAGRARINFQFLHHGTEEPLTISGHGTLRDIDGNQGVFLPENSGLDQVYIIKGNDFLKVDGLCVEGDQESIGPGDKRGWMNFLYNTDNFSVEFIHQARLDRWDKMREEGIEKYGSVEKWAESIRKKYVNAEGKSYCENFTGQPFMRGYAYFDFTSYCLGGIEMKKEPEKRVGSVGCSWEEAQAAGKENPFMVRGYENFQYMIRSEVTPNELTSFEIRDVLEECLQTGDLSGARVQDDTGRNVTDQFEIFAQGQEVVFAAKPDALAMESFTDNQAYICSFPVKRKENADIGKYMADDGYSILVPNHAMLRYARINGSGGELYSDDVWVSSVIPPELEVEKSSSKYEWAVGDLVDYTVTVRQKKEHVRAVDLVIEDILPEYLQFLEGEHRIETSPGVRDCVFERTGADGWRVTCPSLNYGESISVHFRCVVLEEANGKEWPNLVQATASNLISLADGEQETVRDIAEVWINSPRLEIDKSTDRYEWSTGEAVTYKIVVSNSAPGTIARDVEVSDIMLPEGLVPANGVDSIEVLDCPQQVEFPVVDKTTDIAYESGNVVTDVRADGSGFRFNCSAVPYSHPVTILFRCIAEERANGRESVNLATVRASNAEERTDDAEIYVNTGDLYVEKTADHYEWQVGEEVAYTVTVQNMREGTVAHGVRIWDTALPQGLRLAAPDSVRIEGIPDSVVHPTAGTQDTPGMPNPENYQETETRRVSYEYAPEGNGWRLAISDLPAAVPVSVTFFCIVTEEANGMESINMANVQAENAPLRTDDAEIYVNTAALSIDKSFENPYLAVGDAREKHEFRVGEQINYKVTVENVQKGSIARNLVISDLALPEGLVLDEGEDAVVIYGVPSVIQNPVAGTDDQGNMKNPENYGETVEKQVLCNVIRQGQGWIASVSDLPYHMPVTVCFRCIVQEPVNGLEIVTAAQAYADNAQEVSDSTRVWINSPVLKVEKAADKEFYKYGDIVTYQIRISQEQTGCVARDVEIHDIIDTPGMRLMKDSIVLLDENGRTVEAMTEAREDNSFMISTQRNLINGNRYFIYDVPGGEKAEQILFNPIDSRSEETMTVEYCAAVIDEALAGQTVHNAVTVSSREGLPVTAEETVEIHSPILEITKESDQKEYESGEKGYYKLTIRQLREDVTDRNIVIEDNIQTGGKILPDSLIVRKNNQGIPGAEADVSESGFVIRTGTELSDRDKLEVFYEVVFENSAANGIVHNRAAARGNVSPETVAECEVYVKEKEPEPSAAPEPTVTPEPTSTPEPTPTIQLDEPKKPSDGSDVKPTDTPTPQPTAATCPRLTPFPTGSGSFSSGTGNNGTGNFSSGNSYNGSGGYSSGSGYSGYQSGSLSGGAKTGDERPFRKMVILAAAGVFLLSIGIIVYRKSKRHEDNR